jgi:uncharacterized protein
VSEPLPQFRYHPHAYEDGSILRRADVCGVCGQARGWLVAGGLHSAKFDGEVCPWCTADGTAATRFDGHFNELEGGARPEAEDAVAHRTPPILSWQDWDWPVCCADATVYEGMDGAEYDVTEYRFRCAHCGTEVVREDAS